MFTPTLIQFDEHIFQMGWFNHQVDQDFMILRIFFIDSLICWSCRFDLLVLQVWSVGLTGLICWSYGFDLLVLQVWSVGLTGLICWSYRFDLLVLQVWSVGLTGLICWSYRFDLLVLQVWSVGFRGLILHHLYGNAFQFGVPIRAFFGMVNWHPVTELFGTQSGRSRYLYIHIISWNP